jgi:hypothetical protein
MPPAAGESTGGRSHHRIQVLHIFLDQVEGGIQLEQG